MNSKQRTLAQNAFMWPMLRQIAEQLNAVNAEHLQANPGDRLSDEDMKDFLMQQFVGDDMVVIPNLARVMMRRPRTSQLEMPEFAEFLEFSLAWAATNSLSVMMPPEYAQWASEQGPGVGPVLRGADGSK